MNDDEKLSEQNDAKQPLMADDETESVGLLLKLRLPWLFGGLIGGMFMTLFISRFEEVLKEQLILAFFVPLIVYLAAAVGEQTDVIFVRNAADGKINAAKYVVKEFFLGLALGVIFGVILFLFALVMFQSYEVALTVGLAIFITTSLSTMVGLAIPTLLRKYHKDPAVGASPFFTVIQDFLSVVIYFIVATLVVLR